MAIDKWFAVKIALFNSLGFSYITAGVTYVDARLTTHVVYGPRHYRAGYTLSVIGGLLIFAGNDLRCYERGRFAVLPPRVSTPGNVFMDASAIARVPSLLCDSFPAFWH
jgi:hypothetical protein